MVAIRARVRRGVVVSALCCALPAACQRSATLERSDVTDEDTPRELAALVRELMPRLERLSGLDRTEPVRVRRQQRHEVRSYIEQRLTQEMPPAELDGIRATYTLLGLIPDTLDLRALLLDLYTEQVVGYYDPRRATLYVVEGATQDALRPVLVHELVHALQDQHTNLDSLIARDRGNDRQTAAHAAMEGHAMVVMFASLAEEATNRTVDPVALPSPAQELGPALSAQSQQFPVFRRAPPVIRETLLFPYVAGSDFVHTLWSHRRGADHYPAPIDSLLPQSTQQIIEPVEHFVRTRTEPVEIRFDGVPVDARVLYENTLGQLETGILLDQHLGTDARTAASGWRGDRFVVLHDTRGPTLIWVSLWSATTSADRFADALRRAAARRPHRAVTIERNDIDGHPAVRVVDLPAPADAAFRDRLRTITPRLLVPLRL